MRTKRAPLAWCHGCAQLIRAETGTAIPSGLDFPYWKYRRQSNDQQARMSPARRNTSVAPDSAAALSYDVVTDRAWWFAGIPHSRLTVVLRPDVARLDVHSYYPFASLFYLVIVGLRPVARNYCSLPKLGGQNEGNSLHTKSACHRGN